MNAMHRLSMAAFERAPAGLDAVFQVGRRFVMPLLRPLLPVARLHGPDKWQRPASILVVGGQMTANLLAERMFAAGPACEKLGRVALPWAGQLQGEADLVLATVPRGYAGLFGRTHLHAPSLVGFAIRVASTTAATLAHASETVRDEARVVPKAGYGWTLSTAGADFDRFFHDYYLPFVAARFGPHAIVREESVLRRHFRHGGAIVWLHRDGRTLCGELIRRQGSVLERLVQALAVIEGRPKTQPSPQLAMGAAVLELAIGMGVTRIELGGAVPSLRDGVARVKRAWGAHAHQMDANHRTLLVAWPRFGSASQAFLHVNPLIVLLDGRLVAVTAAAPGEAAEPALARRLWRQLVPAGVERLFLLGSDRWAALGLDGRPEPSGKLVLCPPCSSAEFVAGAARAV
jgi:hypothetical protein